MRNYQMCSRCVMDTTDPNIVFDERGCCNHCTNKISLLKSMQSGEEYTPQKMREFVSAMKKAGADKKYDCIMGVSGGVDSSYLCHLLAKMQLRPLLVHFDNGWNTSFAEENIEKILNKLHFEYVVYKVDEEEFFELQRAYFRAGVIDIEALTDQALAAVLYQKAEENNIHYVISGNNIMTESIMGSGWNYTKWDILNIVDICQKFSKRPMVTYPLFNYLKVRQEYTQVDLLNYIAYNKTDAIKLLEEVYGWQSYPGKHYESYFTKFYQAYILPRKFNVDKRKAHLSDLIVAREISRSEALRALQQPLYTAEDLATEKAFVLGKLGYSEAEFEEIMNTPPVSHYAFDHV